MTERQTLMAQVAKAVVDLGRPVSPGCVIHAGGVPDSVADVTACLDKLVEYGRIFCLEPGVYSAINPKGKREHYDIEMLVGDFRKMHTGALMRQFRQRSGRTLNEVGSKVYGYPKRDSLKELEIRKSTSAAMFFSVLSALGYRVVLEKNDEGN